MAGGTSILQDRQRLPAALAVLFYGTLGTGREMSGENKLVQSGFPSLLSSLSLGWSFLSDKQAKRQDTGSHSQPLPVSGWI